MSHYTCVDTVTKSAPFFSGAPIVLEPAVWNPDRNPIQNVIMDVKRQIDICFDNTYSKNAQVMISNVASNVKLSFLWPLYLKLTTGSPMAPEIINFINGLIPTIEEKSAAAHRRYCLVKAKSWQAWVQRGIILACDTLMHIFQVKYLPHLG